MSSIFFIWNWLPLHFPHSQIMPSKYNKPTIAASLSYYKDACERGNNNVESCLTWIRAINIEALKFCKRWPTRFEYKKNEAATYFDLKKSRGTCPSELGC